MCVDISSRAEGSAPCVSITLRASKDCLPRPAPPGNAKVGSVLHASREPGARTARGCSSTRAEGSKSANPVPTALQFSPGPVPLVRGPILAVLGVQVASGNFCGAFPPGYRRAVTCFMVWNAQSVRHIPWIGDVTPQAWSVRGRHPPQSQLWTLAAPRAGTLAGRSRASEERPEWLKTLAKCRGVGKKRGKKMGRAAPKSCQHPKGFPGRPRP